MKNHGCSDALYGIGIIGAAVYFFKGVTGLGAGIAALVKAIFWPGFAVYKLLELLKV